MRSLGCGFGPITRLLTECKRRKPSSQNGACNHCNNSLIRTYYFLCGQKKAFYHGLVGIVLIALETIRTESGSEVFHRLLVPAAGACMISFLWVNATAGGITSSYLDQLIVVAKLVESNVPTHLQRRNRLVVRAARTYFWFMAVESVIVILPMIAEPLTNSTLPMPIPLPDSDLVGRFQAKILYIVAWIWQSGVLFCGSLGFAWVDSIFFATCLILYSLTILLAESFRSNAFNGENIAALIRAHQILLNAGKACNEIMSLMLFVCGSMSAYLIVVTGYTMKVDHVSYDRILDMAIAIISVIRINLISDLIKAASLDVATAVYESAWTDALFDASLDVRLLVSMITLRAHKPMNLRSDIVGECSNAFLLKFFRALYTYFQALEKLA